MSWDIAFFKFLKKLEEKKPVIVCGDLNVAHRDIDLKNPKSNYNRCAGYMQEEIDGINNYINSGFIDTFRHFYPEEIKYTWWSYRNRTWPGSDRGRRLDHIWVTPSLNKYLKKALVFQKARGWERPSDHVPVVVDMAID